MQKFTDENDTWLVDTSVHVRMIALQTISFRLETLVDQAMKPSPTILMYYSRIRLQKNTNHSREDRRCRDTRFEPNT
jgi:hypothetical protein